MKTYFTSDQHYGHANIIKYCSRPYQNVADMNVDLIARHNATVGPDDTVIHLGDFSMSEKVAAEILPHLNGQHHLIPGNHDACYPTHKKNRDGKARERYLAYGFQSVKDYDWYTPGDYYKPYLMSHVPWQLDEFDKRPKNRFVFPPDGAKWAVLLHGHVHGAWKKNGSMWNVGVDVWDFRPVTLEQLIDG